MSTKESKINKDFTRGPIAGPLIRFTFPVLVALMLQSLYGAVDLLVVGNYGTEADISGVSTGSQLMMTFTNLVASFSMGTTILLGQKLGAGKTSAGGRIIGTSICLFTTIGLALTVLLTVFAPQLASLLQAPAEAYSATVTYIRICGAAMPIIIAYNLIGSVFRGIGDSKTPLATVAIACVVNIVGDMVLVAGFKMGAAGAAIATAAAQLVSVLASYFIIRRLKLPFKVDKSCIRPVKVIAARVVKLGAPLALSDILVSISFLVILGIVNSLGLEVSSGVGIAEKVCAFIMLVSVSFMDSMAAFVAQNYGAGLIDRSVKTLKIGLLLSFVSGIIMFFVSFYFGNVLASIFTDDIALITIAHEYLKAYAFDCVLTAFLFCFVGFFNGVGKTKFVMAQGIIGAFCVRVPVSFYMSRLVPVSVFKIGLATPISTVIQITLAVIVFVRFLKSHRTESAN